VRQKKAHETITCLNNVHSPVQGRGYADSYSGRHISVAWNHFWPNVLSDITNDLQLMTTKLNRGAIELFSALNHLCSSAPIHCLVCNTFKLWIACV